MRRHNLQLDFSEYKKHDATGPPQSISANKGNQQNINSTERGISLHVCRERRYTTPGASTDISCGYHTAQTTFENQRTSL